MPRKPSNMAFRNVPQSCFDLFTIEIFLVDAKYLLCKTLRAGQSSVGEWKRGQGEERSFKNGPRKIGATYRRRKTIMQHFDTKNHI